jgi:hypothetical protein
VEGPLLQWIPWDIWLALLAAIVVAFAAVYEFAPMLAVYLYLVLASAVVVLVVND